MASKRVSILLVAQLILASWAAIGFASAAGEPTTTLSIQSSYYVDSNGTYVSQNPVFALSSSPANGSTVSYSEYEITNDGQTSNGTYSIPVTIFVNHSREIGLRYRSNSSTGLEPWNNLTLTVDADAPVISLSSGLESPLKYISNQSIYVTSSNHPLNISCSDSGSGINALSGDIGGNQISGSNSVLSLTTQLIFKRPVVVIDASE